MHLELSSPFSRSSHVHQLLCNCLLERNSILRWVMIGHLFAAFRGNLRKDEKKVRQWSKFTAGL